MKSFNKGGVEWLCKKKPCLTTLSGAEAGQADTKAAAASGRDSSTKAGGR